MLNGQLYQSNGLTSWKVVGALVASAAAGAMVALAFAPMTGRDARAYVKQRGQEATHDIANKGRQLWDEQRRRLASAIDAGRREVRLARSVARGSERAALG